MEHNDLTLIPQDDGLAPAPQQDNGLMLFDMDLSQLEYRIPRAKLAQGLTQEVMDGNAQPGQWILPTGQVVASIVGTIVGVKQTRVLWDRSEGQASITCRSDNGSYGRGNPGGNCHECPLAMWNDSTPPLCTLSYEYLVTQDDSDEAFVVSMSTRSATGAISVLNLALRSQQGRVRVDIGSKMVSNKNRKYYTPVPRVVAQKALQSTED